MFKVGTVVSVNQEKATARVEFRDRDGKVSWDLPILFPHTYADKVYWLPKEGELVICLFPPGHRGFGVVLGSLYNAQDTPPTTDRNKVHIKFEDGTRIEYDKGSGKLTVENPKELVIRIQNTSNLTSPTVTIQGDVVIEGNLNVTGNITSIGQTTAQSGLKTSPSGQTIFVDDLVSKYNSHTHTDSSGGSTSVPDQQLP